MSTNGPLVTVTQFNPAVRTFVAVTSSELRYDASQPDVSSGSSDTQDLYAQAPAPAPALAPDSRAKHTDAGRVAAQAGVQVVVVPSEHQHQHQHAAASANGDAGDDYGDYDDDAYVYDDDDNAVVEDPGPDAGKTLGSYWRDACQANELTPDTILFFRSHIITSINSGQAKPISLRKVDATDVIKCSDYGPHPHACLLCDSGARRYLGQLHVVKMSSTYNLMKWLRAEAIEPALALVQLNPQSADQRASSGPVAKLRQQFSKLSGFASRPELVVQAARCTMPVKLPWIAPADAAPAPLLGARWRDVLQQVNAVADDTKRRLREYVYTPLSKNSVRKISISKLGSSEIAQCTGDADYTTDFASRIVIDRPRPDPREQRARCELCQQHAYLANGMHIMPYTAAHYLAEWLIGDEELTVLIEYMPQNVAMDEDTSSGLPPLPHEFRRAATGLSDYMLYVIGNNITEAALCAATQAARYDVCDE